MRRRLGIRTTTVRRCSRSCTASLLSVMASVLLQGSSVSRCRCTGSLSRKVVFYGRHNSTARRKAVLPPAKYQPDHAAAVVKVGMQASFNRWQDIHQHHLIRLVVASAALFGPPAGPTVSICIWSVSTAGNQPHTQHNPEEETEPHMPAFILPSSPRTASLRSMVHLSSRGASSKALTCQGQMKLFGWWGWANVVSVQLPV